MDSMAVVFEAPGRLALRRLALDAPAADDVIVETLASGISTGTEKLLHGGRMPAFPGLGYPLVPATRPSAASSTPAAPAASARAISPSCPVRAASARVRGLFGGAASRLVVPPQGGRRGSIRRSEPPPFSLALAATAHHALAGRPVAGRDRRSRGFWAVSWRGSPSPSAASRLCSRPNRPVAPAPAVTRSSIRPSTRAAALGVILDASGAADILDGLIERLRPGGEIVLAGFYEARLLLRLSRGLHAGGAAFASPPNGSPTTSRPSSPSSTGRLSLDWLVTHRLPAAQAESAYAHRLRRPACLKMILDWSGTA